MKKVFISGCYDILHAGHLQFFKDAKSLGDYLIVSFASDKVLFKHKKRRPSIPQDHKLAILKSICIIDEVVIGENTELGLDFKDHLLNIKPDILAVTEDDAYSKIKKQLCLENNIQYIKIAKNNPQFTETSTSSIVNNIRAPHALPLRVDFAGGWLDVPKFSKIGEYVVNCAISPLVSLYEWKYKLKSGLGGSAAWAMLNGNSGIESELNLGCGWQDPAVISERGLCVWRSGPVPVLEYKKNPDFLNGKMALLYTGIEHDTPSNANKNRNFELIKKAGRLAYESVISSDLLNLSKAINISYECQLSEGMQELPSVEKSLAKKYCGGGWGGYALYMFENSKDRNTFVEKNKNTEIIEPFI